MISYPFSDLLASRFQDDRLEYRNSSAQLVIATDCSEMGFRFHAKRLSLERDTASSPLGISLFWVSEKLAKIPIEFSNRIVLRLPRIVLLPFPHALFDSIFPEE
jgi:hypothetical protein